MTRSVSKTPDLSGIRSCIPHMRLCLAMLGLLQLLGQPVDEDADLVAQVSCLRIDDVERDRIERAVGRADMNLGRVIRQGGAECGVLHSQRFEQVGGEVPAGMPSGPVFREHDKIGRNDPCPCGSGKKYKQCHGKLV